LSPRSRARNSEWLGLSDASRLLGVSPATLRRWSDAGRLRVFTTPGGHRRFPRSALERLLPGEHLRRPDLRQAGMTPARISRTYRREAREMSAELPWVLALTDEQRELFRERGRVLAGGLLLYLDAADPAGARRHLRSTSVGAGDYGQAAASLGLSLSQTVEGFLRFRTPFLHELAAVARRRGFDTDQTTDLLETAERGMDALLLATMKGHGAASNGRSRSPQRRSLQRARPLPRS
jgi:excisionase family DNA binding protein